METKKLKYGSVFTSVENPEQFSKTWESVSKGVGFILTLLLAIKGVDGAIASQQVTNIYSALTLLGGAIVASWQAGNALFGILRKVTVRN